MPRTDPGALEDVSRRLLVTAGATDSIARQVARSLVLANLRGHSSHGVRRIPQYAEMISNGRIDPTATPSIERETKTTAVVDGQSAFGQIVGRAAVEAVVERATEQGLAAVGVRDATHLGRIGEWAERVAENDLAFIGFVNGQSTGSVTVPGSSQRRLFTNPIAIGFPSFGTLEFPVVLDIATSQVANGKIREHETRDEPIPEGWAIKPDGTPQTDPSELLGGYGALLPLGGLTSGYKGFGLSLAAELFASNLGDGLIVGQEDASYSNAAAFIALDPTLFTTEERIADRIAVLESYVRSTESEPGLTAGTGANGDTALLPHESEYVTSANRREHGIPIPDEDVELLRKMADDEGVTGLPEGW